MDFRALELFLAVLQEGGVTRAAEKMNLSAGAVSLQLHKLANELRTDLFVKSGKRLIPTPAALQLMEKSKILIGQLHQIEREFSNDPTGDIRPFEFASGATTLIHRLGKPLRLLRKQFPNTPVRVTVAPTEEMVAGLHSRRFDLALISLPVASETLHVMPLFEEELLLIRAAPKSVRGWHVSTLKPSEIDDGPFILYPKRSNMREIIDGFFAQVGVSPRVTMEADDTEVIKRLVESGFGTSILPEYALRSQPKFFHAYRVAGHKLARRQALALAQSDHPRALSLSIAKFLHAALMVDKK